MNIVFFGTNEFSAVVAEAILRSEHKILAIVAQPDKANSRGGKVKFNALKQFALNNNIETIPDYCFNECISLEKVEMGNKVRVINKYAFKSCRKILSINLSNDLESIIDGAFENCESLKEIIIPDKVHTICSYVFRNCCNIEHIELPLSLTSLGNEVFKDCKKLQKLVFKSIIKNIGTNILNGIENELIVDFPGTVEQWMELTKTRSVCVSHPTQNDFHYYGDSVDEYVPTVYEDRVIISALVNYKLICKEQ